MLRVVDDLRRQFADRDVGPLGGPAQQVERLVGAAALLGDQHAFRLLDHCHGGELRPQRSMRDRCPEVADEPGSRLWVTRWMPASGWVES